VYNSLLFLEEMRLLICDSERPKEKALKNSDARRSLRSSSASRNNAFWRRSGGNGRSRFVLTKS
jgi:hypothetical protein